MRSNNKILKIVKVKFPTITFLSNNGEFRKINIKKLIDDLNFEKGDFGYELIENKDIFNEVELVDFALAWKNISSIERLPNNEEFQFFFHLDPIVTIENSMLDEQATQKINYGRSIKSLRKNTLRISQEELGKKIGTDKQYISKVENYKTDLELKTLRKIYEVGLNKELVIAYYDKEDPINSFTNSVFNYKFLKWAKNHKEDLELIEGIGVKTIEFLNANNIQTINQLSNISFSELLEVISKRKSINNQHPDTWITQAKMIENSDWLSAIKLQRNISQGSKSNYSKIEALAKKDIKEELFLM